ncbi:ATP-binding cassette domain-containing protein [Tamlana sp. 2_MG-2023]|uniref:ABC transporter ATP-binding protein n=1 Tax=unclassified Tamlana TaxID=2614803 RepID=UPI0026E463E3|nr:MULTISPECIES: ATP-binding cassette domain-containing protein [unclassified Tamlana]MDO6759515.1 ATP-binding cassette domain-containing protein [Tamlana sp. 2_MG-2023]MDO6790346.1 ATP-binding cassette domain-containing protein [Tamlana sp. 1_MG-2023]
MIYSNHLTFQYEKKGNLFSFPNITLNEQENLLILGKSGIGKTTLLHLLAGLLKPTEGNVIINDTDLHKLSNNQLDKFRGENIGLVFQKKHAIGSLNVLQNLQTRLYFSKKKVKNTAIEDLLKQLDLYDFKHSKVTALSEGQLQRLGIASAVIHEPQVILADEPTSSLDDENCDIVMKLLIEQAERTKANLIVITHDYRVKSCFQNHIIL